MDAFSDQFFYNSWQILSRLSSTVILAIVIVLIVQETVFRMYVTEYYYYEQSKLVHVSNTKAAKVSSRTWSCYIHQLNIVTDRNEVNSSTILST